MIYSGVMNTKTLMDKIESAKKLPSFEVSEEKTCAMNIQMNINGVEQIFFRL